MEQTQAIIDPFTQAPFKLGHTSRTIIAYTTNVVIPILASNRPFPDDLSVRVTSGGEPVNDLIVRLNDDGGRTDKYYPYEYCLSLELGDEDYHKFTMIEPFTFVEYDYYIKYTAPPRNCNAFGYRWGGNMQTPPEDAFYFSRNDGEFAIDEITPQLSLARGDIQGLYNPAAGEGQYGDIGWEGPADTVWAFGGFHGNPEYFTIDDAPNLFFTAWRYSTYGNPPEMTGGTNGMIKIKSTNTYIPIAFTSWSAGDGAGNGGGGGFSYYRPDTSGPPECLQLPPRTLPAGWTYINKPTGADGSLPQYQDIVTDTFIFARGDTGRPYNAAPAGDGDDGSSTSSPRNTQWAFLNKNGNNLDLDQFNIANIANITFDTWQNAHAEGPIDVVGMPGIVKIMDDPPVYFDIVMIRWDSGEEFDVVGFEYMRSPVQPEPNSIQFTTFDVFPILQAGSQVSLDLSYATSHTGYNLLADYNLEFYVDGVLINSVFLIGEQDFNDSFPLGWFPWKAYYDVGMKVVHKVTGDIILQDINGVVTPANETWEDITGSMILAGALGSNGSGDPVNGWSFGSRSYQNSLTYNAGDIGVIKGVRITGIITQPTPNFFWVSYVGNAHVQYYNSMNIFEVSTTTSPFTSHYSDITFGGAHPTDTLTGPVQLLLYNFSYVSKVEVMR